MSPEQYELHLKKLDELMSQQGSDAIYSFGTWLKALGLKLTVAVCTVAPALIVVKDAMFPEPLTPRPIEVLLFVQL